MSAADPLKRNVIQLPDSSAPDYSEEQIALDFARLSAEDVRYVSEWQRWMLWDGSQWRPDKTLAAYDRIRPITRERAKRAESVKNGGTLSRNLASSKTVAGVERLARSDRRLAASTNQWDADPMLLGTPGGYIDLWTGKTGPTDRLKFVTQLTSVTPDPGVRIDGWLTFLERVTGDDQALQDYLQRVAGYCLTGLTQEHVFFFLFGTGRNGKGVFTRILMKLLGEHACMAPLETLIDQNGTQHPAGLAMLRGKRLVVASETESDRAWAEARIKLMTGGDPIAARFMRQDFFEYTPQFKLMVSGNHRPVFRHVDEALRARLHLVPFDVTIPEEERDAGLTERLFREEGAGILHWMIEGCCQWKERGVSLPPKVSQASRDFFTQEDFLGSWIEENCEVAAQYYEGSTALFEAWRISCGKANEEAGKQKRFSMRLADRGFPKGRLADGKVCFQGLRLKDAPKGQA